MDILVKLRQKLLSMPFAKENTARTHVRIRCPICGDSTRHQDSTHCYINIVGNKPITYYCFKCNEGGWINDDFLSLLGIDDINFRSKICKYNIQINPEKPDYLISNRLVLPNTPNKKIKYLKDRLEINNCESLNIVYSIEEFLSVNGLEPSMDISILESFIGFLSADNTYIIFRNTKNDKIRYINYPIYPDNNGSKLYMIPGEYDLLAENIECNICEGVFDAISCYANINNYSKDNKIYVAVNGSGFLSAIKKILSLGFIGNLNVKIYSDSDKEIEYYKNLSSVSKYCKSIRLFYNEYSKDIGVPKRLIKIVEAYRGE